MHQRFEPFGQDSQNRELFVLDDFRLYRRTSPPPPAPPSKAKSKAKSRKSKSTRASKRRKQSSPEPEHPLEDEDATELQIAEEPEDDGLGGMKWECVCVTLEDYQDYMASIRKSKNADEKNLYSRLQEEILPELARVAEEQVKREAKKMKELEVLQKLATAKRSSRISAKLEKQREIDEAEEVQRRREAELAMAKAEQDKQRHMEDAHESRRQTREQRIREREAAKILQEETLRKLEEEEEKIAADEARGSERHLKARMKKAQQELKKLKEKEFWIFDCEKCSMHGECLVCAPEGGCTKPARLMQSRMMVLTNFNASGASSGSTANAIIFPRKKPKEKSSSLSAHLANAKSKLPTGQSFLL
jgi:hypothetical protein